MNVLKERIKFCSERTETGVNVNLMVLAHDTQFRKEIITQVVNYVKSHDPKACVWIPAYPKKSHLSELINEICISLQVSSLTTGCIENIGNLYCHPKKIVLVKQSFDKGVELATQVQKAKTLGYDISVLCLMAHSKERFEEFAKMHSVEMTSLVFLDEI